MENKIERAAVISLILGVIFIFVDGPEWHWAILFISIAILLPLVKSMWNVSVWASKKIK